MSHSGGWIGLPANSHPRYRAAHAVHTVIRFSSESSPEWLRNSLWWTSKFDSLTSPRATDSASPSRRTTQDLLLAETYFKLYRVRARWLGARPRLQL